MQSITRFSTTCALALSLAMFVGCGEEDNHDNHDHGENHEDGEEHVCVHFEGSDQVAIAGAAAADGTLEETFQEHSRIEVTLPGDADTGYVKWTPEEAGDFVFWLGSDVTFEVLDGTTALTAEEMGGAAMGCEEKAVKHIKFDVEAKTYTIKIGPAASTGATVAFVAEHAGEGHDHEGEE